MLHEISSIVKSIIITTLLYQVLPIPRLFKMILISSLYYSISFGIFNPNTFPYIGFIFIYIDKIIIEINNNWINNNTTSL